MPTFNQLVRKGRNVLADKSTAPALQKGFKEEGSYRSELPTEAWRLHGSKNCYT